jgi:RNA polymerase sigma-70 factor, ECF subfamily
MIMATAEPLDTSLIKQCLDGEIQRYGVLVDRYSARIINLAYMMVGDRHDAEDIAQDAFVRAYKGLPRFERKAKFSSWLYQIALNLCKDYLKAKSRHAKSVDDEHLETLDANPRDEASLVILEEELSEKMREVIRTLPYLYRESFVLRHLQGMEYEEVAAITGVPADTVRVRAYRAREMLREKMAPAVDTFWREKAAKEKVRAKD